MASAQPVTVTVSEGGMRRILVGSAMILLGLIYRRWMLWAGLGLLISDRRVRGALGSGASSLYSLAASRSRKPIAVEVESSSD